MAAPNEHDPYVDDIPENPGEPPPKPPPGKQATDWPDDQVPPQVQSDGGCARAMPTPKPTETRQRCQP